MSALTVSTPPGGDVAVRAVALVLHGGRENSVAPVRARHLAVMRMLPFARALASAGQRCGLAVARLRYSQRGWNGDLRSPVGDTQQALAALARRFPSTAVALLGHSMGARTALHVAGDPAVRVVVALAPWVVPSDPVTTMTGRRLLVVHGEADHVTDPSASCRYAQAAAAVASSSCWLGVRGENHAMLRRPRLWHDVATGVVLGSLFGEAVAAGADGRSGRLVHLALAGEPRFVV